MSLNPSKKSIDDRWNFAFVVVIVIVKVVGGVIVVVVYVPRNLSLKFGLNGGKSSWDIDDVEFPVVGGCGGVKSFSCQTQLLLC